MSLQFQSLESLNGYNLEYAQGFESNKQGDKSNKIGYKK